MEASKRIAKNGSITLPKKLRSEAGYFDGNAVDIMQDGDTVTITPHVPVCRFCGTADNVKAVLGINICTDCAHKIHEAVINNDPNA